MSTRPARLVEHAKTGGQLHAAPRRFPFLDIEETDHGTGDEEAFEGMNAIPDPL